MNEPLRVAVVQGQFGLGGAERQIYELVRRVDRREFEVRCVVLSPELDPYGPLLQREGIEVVGFDRHTTWDAGRVLKLRRLLRAWRTQVIYGVGHATAALCQFARVGRNDLALVPSIRSTVITHPFPKPQIYRWMFRSAPRTVVNSHRGAEFCQREFGLPLQRTVVIGNGLDVAALEARAAEGGDVRALLGVPPDTPIVLFVGKDSWQKQPRRFFAVAERVAAEHPTAQFVAIGWKLGAGDRARLGVTHPRVQLLGPRHDVPAWIKQANVLVMTSETEGCPNVVLEAAALGTPVIAPDVGDVARIFGAEASSRLVTLQDEADYARLVLAELAGGELRQRMSEALRSRVASEYSMEQMVSRTCDVWRDAAPLS